MSGSQVPLDALQRALASEHAAIWAYGVAGAFVPGSLSGQLDKAATAHQARRDATERVLIDAGASPVPPEPGYLIPEPVTNAGSAWRSVVERSPADPELRVAALDALTAAAVRATRWRAATGTTPPTVPFPGTP
jgi:Domain of unknown function (DUF4439)